MNVNCFLIFLVTFTTTNALQYVWNTTNRNGDRTIICNYSYTYIHSVLDNMDQVISNPFECGDITKSCTHSLQYNAAFTTNFYSPEGLDLRNLEDIKEKAGELFSKADMSYQLKRFLTGTFTCNIEPGYRVQVVAKPKFHNLNGTLDASCSISGKGGSLSNVITTLTIKTPAKSDTDEQIASNIVCKSEPAANINQIRKLCAPEKMADGKMFDAVGDVLHRTILNTANNGAKTLEHTYMHNYNVWAIGMCWNGLGKDSCRACVHYLVDKIWKECDGAKGAKLSVLDCGIWYSFENLTMSDFPNSFPGRYNVQS